MQMVIYHCKARIPLTIKRYMNNTPTRYIMTYWSMNTDPHILWCIIIHHNICGSVFMDHYVIMYLVGVLFMYLFIVSGMQALQ